MLYHEVGQVVEGADRAIVKIVVTRGPAERGYRQPQHAQPSRIVVAYPCPGYPDEYQRRGVVVRLCETRLGTNPALAGIKHLNRLEQVLARSEWDDDSIAEGLMRDLRGDLVEGTMSNLFLVRNGRLVTPALDGCGIAGVMRARTLAVADGLGIPWDVGRVSLPEAFAAEALFLTNSLIGIWPVKRFEQQDYPVSPLVQRLQQQLSHDHLCA